MVSVRYIREALVGRKVLLVDDEPMVLETIALMLDQLGCEVETTSSGAKALNLLSSDPHIDILIADINLPDLEGRELAFRAK